VNANVPDDKSQSTGLDPATQEKIREFCYELALALRRITGKVVEEVVEEPPVDNGEKLSEISKKTLD
jgi:hypothetical protein